RRAVQRMACNDVGILRLCGLHGVEVGSPTGHARLLVEDMASGGNMPMVAVEARVMTPRRIHVAGEFSKFPAGRYRADGPHSGQRFREEFLEPALRGSLPVTV